MHPYLFVLLSWCDSALFILSRSAQRASAKEMDSKESPRHQTSAHVGDGQYTGSVRAYSLPFGMRLCCLHPLPYLTVLLMFSEMASVVTADTVQRHSQAEELQNQPSAAADGERRKFYQFYNVLEILQLCFTEIPYNGKNRAENTSDIESVAWSEEKLVLKACLNKFTLIKGLITLETG